MSYRQPDTGNPLNNYFHNLSNFYQLAPHLLSAKSEQEFLVWLEKLEKIDRRSLFLYLKKNKDQINEKYLSIAQHRFWEAV